MLKNIPQDELRDVDVKDHTVYSLGFGLSSRQHSAQYPLAHVVIESQTSSTLCSRRKQMQIVTLKARANGSENLVT